MPLSKNDAGYAIEIQASVSKLSHKTRVAIAMTLTLAKHQAAAQSDAHGRKRAHADVTQVAEIFGIEARY